MMKRLWLGILIAIGLVSSTPALAAETITSFQSNSSLTFNNSLYIDETIDVDFDGISHHGIYRDIPVVRRDGADAYYYTFSLISSSEETQVSRSGDFEHIRLGNPERTVDGRAHYRISYSLSPVALAAPDHDRVIMNVTGQGWEYPILKAKYSLTLPKSPIGTPVCYSGQSGTTQQNCQISDNTSSTPEITATIIDLAIRGYLRIELTRKKSLFQPADYSFTKLRDDTDILADYEKVVFDIIFGAGQSPIKVSQLTKSFDFKINGQAKLIQMALQVKTSLEAKGYYPPVKKKFSLMPQWLTEQGISEWAKVEGFKLYLSVAEKARIDFSDAPTKTPERFNKLLPYAVALGVEKQWAKQFAGIDMSQNSGWYVGDNTTFGAALFASSFAADLSNNMSSSFAGSSGGGSVGGGGGGGGGGGW